MIFFEKIKSFFTLRHKALNIRSYLDKWNGRGKAESKEQCQQNDGQIMIHAVIEQSQKKFFHLNPDNIRLI